MNTPANLSQGCIVVRSLTHGETYAHQIPDHFKATIEENLRTRKTHAIEVLACECVHSWAFEVGEQYTIALTSERDPGAARLSRKLVNLGKHYEVLPDEED